MSTTASVIISDALKEIGVIGEGETPSATMLSDGLRMLNRLCDTLSNIPSFGFTAYPLLSKTMAGESSFDIGPTGDVVADRPIQIKSAYCTLNGEDFPVEIVTQEKYDEIENKTTVGDVPWCLYYGGQFPDGMVYLWPQSTGGTLKMRTVSVVKQFSSTSTQIEMPPGAEDYLMLGLAIRMAPSYQKSPSQDTVIAYKRARKLFHRANQQIPDMELSDMILATGA